ncbi:leucyl aminopeptidase family protein [Spirosoma utsteinense]|uniref:Probable cytosol aminopeptidase n=1 Tax=Spirosoma utsteinense TaxID=2585773 RepID=A0ABR6W559_9BACT|nr:leucyl aminopeptidase family protein [Spirosoma utsteinense]MBC3791359.1 leucyl aminopeptidase [Spirosoma utsteinense]
MIINLQTQITPTGDLVIPISQSDALPDQLAAVAQRLNLPASVLQRDFSADASEVLPIYDTEGQRTYLLGLGKEPQAISWLRSFRKLFFSQKNKLSAQVGIDLSGFDAAVIEAAVLGVLGGSYDLRLYKTDKTDTSAFFSDAGQLTLYLPASQHPNAQDAVTRAEAMGQTQREMLDLMNAPANYKTPQTLADWALNSGRQYGYDVRVLDKTELERQGLGALLSVSQGSDVPPVLIVAEYKPEGVDAVHTLGLVGKGVTFDTGGVSIKSSANMHLMKSDMGGAAAVLGTLEVAAKLKLPIHLIGIVPSTENSTDGRSTKPGDVITSYSGKTIEIIDTDAEGRVILADGLGYLLRHFRPDVVIDLATLTGSVIAALGYHAAGLFTQNDELAVQLAEAGNRTGERLWRMPLWDDYKEDIKSDVADVKNFSGKPLAGSISAAKFLESFTENHPAWAHLDIAGMAFADTEFGTQKNATGFGIRLLIDYIHNMA